MTSVRFHIPLHDMPEGIAFAPGAFDGTVGQDVRVRGFHGVQDRGTITKVTEVPERGIELTIDVPDDTRLMNERAYDPAGMFFIPVRSEPDGDFGSIHHEFTVVELSPTNGPGISGVMRAETLPTVEPADPDKTEDAPAQSPAEDQQEQ